MLKHIKLIVPIIMTVLLASCGGGSGGGTAAPTPSTRMMTTNVLHTYATGDTIVYAVSITSTDNTGFTVNAAGVYTDIFSINSIADPYSGMMRSKVTRSGALNVGTAMSQSINNTLYFSQDAAGIHAYGDAVSGWLVTPYLARIGTLNIGVIWNSSVTYPNGDTLTATDTIVGKAVVTTLLGSFETYKVVENFTIYNAATATSLATTDVGNATYYVVPSIGASIKSLVTYTSTDSTGATTTVTRTTSINTTNIVF